MIRRGISFFTVLLIVMGLFPSYSYAGSGVTSLTTLTLSSGKAVADLMDFWKFYADVANNVNEITVTPTAEDADSKIEVNGVEVASGSPSGAIALNVGVNTIEILVTPAAPLEEYKKITTLTVTRAGGPGSNTILNFLGLFLESDIPGDLPVGFGFNKSLPFYDFIDLVGQNKVLIDPQPEDNGATVTVNGIEATRGVKVPVSLLMGDNTITVVVTASDGTTTRTYTLIINRLPGADTSLIELGLNNGVPVVDPSDNKKYSVNFANSWQSTRVYPVAKMDYATITVNGKSVVNGGLSEAIPLEVGSNTITVVVTSENGLATTNYTLTVTRAAAPVGYKVTFVENNGSLVEDLNEVSPGSTIARPESTHDGYLFGGWYKEWNFITLWDFDTDTVNANTTLYAKWTPTYTVVFDSQGGSSVLSAPGLLSGATVPKPSDPTKAGYTFSGWYADENFSSAWNFATDTVILDTWSVYRTLYAKWTAIPVSTYTVTFDSKDGSAVTSATGILSGATVTKPTDPTRAGYTFSGWYKDEGYASAWNFTTDTVSANTTLYAKWTAIPVSTYTVTFDSKEGSAVASLTGILSGATVAKPTDPTRAGYTFSGWYKEEGYASAWNFSTDTVSANTTLYAKWTAIPVSTYTVTFDSKEGSLVPSETGILSGATVAKPTDPMRDGYTFSGWYKEEGYASAWNFSTDTVSANTTLYAKWTAIPVATYTVTFDSKEGSAVASLTGILSGATVTKPADPTRAGYTFSGWYKEESYTSAWNFTTDMVSTNTTLYAKWTAIPVATYTVTFDSKEGSAVASEAGILSGATVTKPTDPTRAGYTFSGWYKDEGYASAWNFTTDTVSANTTLYAKWTAIPVSTYTVTFDSKEGSAVASEAGILSGATVTKPTDPTRAGYTFSGWYKDEGYASAWNFTTDKVSMNTTLYAKWTAIPVSTYTVTFDSKDGSAIASLIGIAAGATVTKPTDPTRAGYTFSGWYKEESYASAWNFTTDKVSANTTLYAKWTAIPVSTYTVTFDSKDGSAIASLIGIAAGATVTKPTDPTRAGYTFSGWYKDEGYASAWNFATDTVSANTTLYAKWTAIPVATYTVTFDSKDGSTVASLTGITAGATVTKPTDPTRAGYTFSGWYKDEGYASAWNFITDTVSANTTLYAKWTEVPSGDVSGGGSGEGVSVPDNSPVISDNGELTLPVGRPGTVSLSDDEITIEIPADATDASLRVTVETLLDTDELLKHNEVLVSEVFEVLKNVPGTFKKNITLKLAFDTTKLSDGERASIFYYDEEKKEWVEVGGVVSGGFITAEVNHFTKFAVLAVGDTAKPVIEFGDIAGHWAEEAIRQGASQGITAGYPDGTFKPNLTVTRAQFAVMLMNVIKPAGVKEELAFEDASQIPAWAKNAVAAAKQAGIITGYDDGTFRPNAEITRVEMAAMIVKALDLTVEANAVTGFADNSEIPTWAKGAVAALTEIGLMQGKGDNRFDSEDKASRAEAVTVLLRMLEQQKTKE